MATPQEVARFRRALDDLEEKRRKAQRKMDDAADARGEMFLASDLILDFIGEARAFLAGDAEGSADEPSPGQKIFGWNPALEETLKALDTAERHTRVARYEEYEREAIRARLLTALALGQYSLSVAARRLEARVKRGKGEAA
jgi:hypothetical protein